MFDPTAFDNMKVVLEGYLYDLDLTGEMTIIDRNDWMNLAKFSRCYEISYTDATVNRALSAKISLQATLQEIAAELHPTKIENQMGAHLSITFIIKQQDKNKVKSAYDEVIRQWGDSRLIEQKLIQLEKELIQEVKVKFERLVTEDQLGDFQNLIDHTQETLLALDK